MVCRCEMTDHTLQCSTGFCSKPLRCASLVQTVPADVRSYNGTVRVDSQIGTPLCDAMLLAIQLC